MNSMTGFGKSEQTIDGRKLKVEIKTVNNRFLDINIRQPKFMVCFDEHIRTLLKKNIARGHIDVFIYYSSERSDSKTVNVDMSLISGYTAAAEKIAAETDIKNDLTVFNLMRLPDALIIEENPEEEKAVLDLLSLTLKNAVVELNQARAGEGAQLKEDILHRLDLLSEIAENIKKFESTVVDEYREKLKARIDAVLTNVDLDEQRLAQEIALYADKVNITEELVRIKSHLFQFRSLMDQSGAQGRNMDFIVQELNREFNTIGSKSQNSEILNNVIKAKGEIEKIREQIQNVE